MKRDPLRPQAVEVAFPRATYMIILPIGVYLNEALQNASIGDLVALKQDWREERFAVLSKSKVAVNTSYFTQLMRSIYGKRMTWEQLQNIWDGQLLPDGYNAKTWYHDKVLCLTLQPISEEAYLARIEAMEREEERERALEYASNMTESEIRECIQRGEIPPHKDLI